MFSPAAGYYNLREITLGENFTFTGNNITDTSKQAILINPPTATTTGKWIREDGSAGPYTPAELRSNYTSVMAGTWIWEAIPTDYDITFAGGSGATGSMTAISTAAAESYTLPANLFRKFGYTFDHWDDGNNNTYADGATIPANTYSVGDSVTLTAVFTPKNTTANMQDGEFNLYLTGGEEAVFDSIPAGTQYQVWEETPDGWVLVQQSNVSGTVEPLANSEARFVNRYQPGITTAQFAGTKKLDGRPAAAGQFSFVLKEGNTVIETVDTLEGGFFQFSVITYDSTMLGQHTYTITEVQGNDPTIDYDTHTEYIRVTVIDNGDGTLASTVEYDHDGAGFSSQSVQQGGNDPGNGGQGSEISEFDNSTRPGILKINKEAVNGTEANADDEFTIKITFTDESGRPISDDTEIYWYIEGQEQQEPETQPEP